MSVTDRPIEPGPVVKGREILKPAAVLEYQSDLVRWFKTTNGVHAAGSFLESSKKNDGIFASDNNTAKEVSAGLVTMLEHAEAFYVHDDMCALIGHAAKSMPEQRLNIMHDVPFEAGFIWLQDSLTMPDVHGVDCSVRAISWHRTIIGIDSRKKGDILSMALDRDSATQSVMHVLVAFWSDTLDEKEADKEYLEHVNFLRSKGMHIPRLALLHVMPWLEGTPVPNENDRTLFDDYALNDAAASTRSLLDFVRAFWVITQQKIAHTTDGVIDRPARKRLEREGWTKPRVRVVNLRRRERADGERDEDADKKHIEWSKRWLVSGHWRNQWVPSINDHRLIYINPYVKGPDHLPFDPGDRVFRVKR